MCRKFKLYLLCATLTAAWFLGGCSREKSSESMMPQDISPYVVTTIDEHAARRADYSERKENAEGTNVGEGTEEGAKDKYTILRESKMNFALKNMEIKAIQVVMCHSMVCFMVDYKNPENEGVPCQKFYTVDMDGDVRTFGQVKFDESSAIRMIILGREWGSDHVIGIGEETQTEGTEYYVFEIDEEMNILRSMECPFLKEEGLTPVTVLMDDNGLIHVDARPMEREDEKITHFVLNAEGKIEESFKLRGTVYGNPCMQDWVFAEDGALLLRRYVAWENMHGKVSKGIELYSGTSALGLGTIRVLSFFDSNHSENAQYVIRSLSYGVMSNPAAMQLLYADEKGIKLGDLNLDKQKMLMEWETYGMSVRKVLAAEEKEGNRIAVLYMDDMGDYHFVILESNG